MKTLSQILMLLALVILNAESIAQTTLIGIVVDAEGRPLADVVYGLIGFGKGAPMLGDIKYQKTDLGGRFNIQLPSEKSVADRNLIIQTWPPLFLMMLDLIVRQ